MTAACELLSLAGCHRPGTGPQSAHPPSGVQQKPRNMEKGVCLHFGRLGEGSQPTTLPAQRSAPGHSQGRATWRQHGWPRRSEGSVLLGSRPGVRGLHLRKLENQNVAVKKKILI